MAEHCIKRSLCNFAVLYASSAIAQVKRAMAALALCRVEPPFQIIAPGITPGAPHKFPSVHGRLWSL